MLKINLKNMKTILTKVYRSDKDKEGNPLKTKDGRLYTRVSIKTQEHGDKWLSGFSNWVNDKWKEGDKVEIEVEEKGQYLNFRGLSETQRLWNAIAALKLEVSNLKLAVGGAIDEKQTNDNLPQADEDSVNSGDLPF